MKRNYKTGVQEDVVLYAGYEENHTPARGQRTLFVVGVQDIEALQNAATAIKAGHIYFGANQSFPQLATDDAAAWEEWTNMIMSFINQGYFCSLEIDTNCVEGLVESSLIDYNNFIPVVSVKLPYLQLLGYNATIKLDDKGFAATNPGIWTHSLHDLKDRKAFTSWIQYSLDEILQ